MRASLALELTKVVYIRVPFCEGYRMDEREQQRKIRHRLAVLRHAEEVSENVSATCRYRWRESDERAMPLSCA
jgi:hypothetical protein